MYYHTAVVVGCYLISVCVRVDVGCGCGGGGGGGAAGAIIVFSVYKMAIYG